MSLSSSLLSILCCCSLLGATFYGLPIQFPQQPEVSTSFPYQNIGPVHACLRGSNTYAIWVSENASIYEIYLWLMDPSPGTPLMVASLYANVPGQDSLVNAQILQSQVTFLFCGNGTSEVGLQKISPISQPLSVNDVAITCKRQNTGFLMTLQIQSWNQTYVVVTEGQTTSINKDLGIEKITQNQPGQDPYFLIQSAWLRWGWMFCSAYGPIFTIIPGSDSTFNMVTENLFVECARPDRTYLGMALLWARQNLEEQRYEFQMSAASTSSPASNQTLAVAANQVPGQDPAASIQLLRDSYITLGCNSLFPSLYFIGSFHPQHPTDHNSTFCSNLIPCVNNQFDVGESDLEWRNANFAGIISGQVNTSTPRTLISKLNDIVSIFDYGAICDGTGDDSVAINAAISAIAEANGGKLLFPGRGIVCVINNTIMLMSNVMLQLNPGVTIRWTGLAGGTMFSNDISSPLIQGGILSDYANLDANNLAGIMIHIHSPQNCKFGSFNILNGAANTWVYNFTGDSTNSSLIPNHNNGVFNLIDFFVSQDAICGMVFMAGEPAGVSGFTMNQYQGFYARHVTCIGIWIEHSSDSSTWQKVAMNVDTNAIGVQIGSLHNLPTSTVTSGDIKVYNHVFVHVVCNPYHTATNTTGFVLMNGSYATTVVAFYALDLTTVIDAVATANSYSINVVASENVVYNNLVYTLQSDQFRAIRSTGVGFETMNWFDLRGGTSNNLVMASGQIYAGLVFPKTSGSSTQAQFVTGTTGISAVTACYVGVWNSGGTLLYQSDNMAAAITAGSTLITPVTFTASGPVVWTALTAYYVGLVYIATTAPGSFGVSFTAAALANRNLPMAGNHPGQRSQSGFTTNGTLPTLAQHTNVIPYIEFL